MLNGVVANLRNDIVNVRSLHQTFGSVNETFLTQLSNHGMHKIAMDVALQDTFPSFGTGSTTVQPLAGKIGLAIGYILLPNPLTITFSCAVVLVNGCTPM